MKSPVTETLHREVTRSASDGKINPSASAIARAETNCAAGSSSKVVARKKSAPIHSTQPIMIPNDDDLSVEELFMDVILQRHVRRLLSSGPYSE